MLSILSEALMLVARLGSTSGPEVDRRPGMERQEVASRTQWPAKISASK